MLRDFVDVQLAGSEAIRGHLCTRVENVQVARGECTSSTGVARQKLTEGVCEACPQAILQLCLLLSDLYRAWTWTDYFRIAGAGVSLCMAGAALVNREKCRRMNNCSDLPLSELVVLHVWAVPVTVSRLLSLALLLSVHPYWALGGVTLHLVLWGVFWCGTEGVPPTLDDVLMICLYILQFCMTPFLVGGSVTLHLVLHAGHFLLNTWWCEPSVHPWCVSTRPCTLPSSASMQLCLLWDL